MCEQHQILLSLGNGKILQLVRMGAFGISRGLLGKHNQEGKERKDIAVFLVEGGG